MIKQIIILNKKVVKILIYLQQFNYLMIFLILEIYPYKNTKILLKILKF